MFFYNLLFFFVCYGKQQPQFRSHTFFLGSNSPSLFFTDVQRKFSLHNFLFNICLFVHNAVSSNIQTNRTWMFTSTNSSVKKKRPKLFHGFDIKLESFRIRDDKHFWYALHLKWCRSDEEVNSDEKSKAFFVDQMTNRISAQFVFIKQKKDVREECAWLTLRYCACNVIYMSMEQIKMKCFEFVSFYFIFCCFSFTFFFSTSLGLYVADAPHTHRIDIAAHTAFRNMMRLFLFCCHLQLLH